MSRTKLNNEAGFTLLEAIFVLFVVSLIGLIAIGLFPKYEEKKVDTFLEQLRQDIVLMQQSAISHSNSHQLHFYPMDHQYVITNGIETILIRNYDHDIVIDLNTLPSSLTFGPDGNIGRGGTMYVSYKTKKYKIVFQLGAGRFYIA